MIVNNESKYVSLPDDKSKKKKVLINLKLIYIS